MTMPVSQAIMRTTVHFVKSDWLRHQWFAVQFVGSDNKELPIDARDLFGVKDGEEVVIRGVASFNAKLALPIISASG